MHAHAHTHTHTHTHIVAQINGFCKNIALGKRDPICFWSVFFPSSNPAQVRLLPLILHHSAPAVEGPRASLLCTPTH